MNRIYPIVLSGGEGSRLWPLSRSQMPKQLMPVATARSMLQETVLRLHNDSRIMPPVIVSNANHRFIVAAQLQELGIVPTAHLLEPDGRNTAPAAAVGLKIVSELDPEGLVLILPADHHFADVDAFKQAILAGIDKAETGHLVTFGITPKSPETGYGYIGLGAALDGGGTFAVREFCEKPSQQRAVRFLANGGYLWNSGIFLARADALRDEMCAHCPEILAKSAEAVERGCRDLDFMWLDPAAFRACPSEPFDTAVMERTNKAVVVPLDAGWNDVGSWAALWELGTKDESGNVVSGDAIAVDTSDCYIRSDNLLVAAVGVTGLVVVVAGDAVLVTGKDNVQNVRKLVARLNQLGRREAGLHARVDRPWGYYELIEAGERYQVKHLMVKPGAALSLQAHRYRAEHWVVVKGTARVTLDGETMLLAENQSVYIPTGSKHRLDNPGTAPLNIIEVQTGSYLGEDDIVRFEDRYGRASNETAGHTA